MARQAAAKINLSHFCPNPYRGPREAILDIDLTIEEHPEAAPSILRTVGTALTILNADGIPAANWLTTIAPFHKLTPAERDRVRTAVEMRMRAVDARQAA